MTPFEFHHSRRAGWIEVICGSMFCGKTEELIRRVKRAQIARQKVQVFKPVLDNRYVPEAVNSHAGRTVDAVRAQNAMDLLSLVDPDAEVVAVDEVQFFDHAIVDVCQHLAESGKRVICTGLAAGSSDSAFVSSMSSTMIARRMLACSFCRYSVSSA